jgi:DNA replication and repair protein RecF
MAILRKLHLQSFRHFDSFSLEATPGINAIIGPNASGKTSVLEAIYLLAHGKSFRAAQCDTAIQHGQGSFTVFAEVYSGVAPADAEPVSLGLQKSCSQPVKLRLDQAPTKSIRHFTEHLPIQLMTTQSSRYFTDGPKNRRDFLSWGLFYTDPGFYPHWRAYQRALSQRNRALKQNQSLEMLQCWDLILAEAGEAIDALYQDYLTELTPIFDATMHHFLPEVSATLHYARGWDEECSLLAALSRAYERSSLLGYTTVGLHRCDLPVMVLGKPAQDHLSRGQLKLASYALAIAQGQLLKARTGQCPIYLIDDIAAELDSSKQALVLDALESLSAQVFLAAIEPMIGAVSSAASEHDLSLHPA